MALAGVQIGRVQGQHLLVNNHHDLPFTAPGAGTGPLTLMLREWEGGLRDARPGAVRAAPCGRAQAAAAVQAQADNVITVNFAAAEPPVDRRLAQRGQPCRDRRDQGRLEEAGRGHRRGAPVRPTADLLAVKAWARSCWRRSARWCGCERRGRSAPSAVRVSGIVPPRIARPEWAMTATDTVARIRTDEEEPLDDDDVRSPAPPCGRVRAVRVRAGLGGLAQARCRRCLRSALARPPAPSRCPAPTFRLAASSPASSCSTASAAKARTSRHCWSGKIRRPARSRRDPGLRPGCADRQRLLALGCLQHSGLGDLAGAGRGQRAATLPAGANGGQ